MDKWGRQKYADQNYYSENQVKRSLIASGITIVSEVETDFIIFCPFHSNTRSPAGEVHKTNGMFYCFSCQETKELTEVIMVSTNRSYFEAARLIDSKSDNKYNIIMITLFTILYLLLINKVSDILTISIPDENERLESFTMYIYFVT